MDTDNRLEIANRQMRLILGLAMTLVTTFIAGSAVAQWTFTDPATFFAAAGGEATVQSLDFDQVANGTLVPSGTTLEAISFHYDMGGVSAEIVDEFVSPSPPNYLGTDDAGVFQGGDELVLQFGPNTGIGVYFSTADGLVPSDIELMVSGSGTSLDPQAWSQTLADGTQVYFLGVANPAVAFDTAWITSQDGGNFLFNIDRIVVPEPNMSLGLALGAVGLITRPRRRPSRP